jgi:hypothetical protein
LSEVFVAWLHPGDVSSAFAESLSGMLAWDFLRQTERDLPRQLTGMRGFHAGVNIAGPRNGVVREFLARPEWGDWLLQIDVDMLFAPDSVEKLLAAADPVSAPVVGGLCFGATDGELWPTLYDLTEGDDGPYLIRRPTFELDTMQRVTATGGAFLMMHRSVLEAVRDKAFNAAFPWFQETELCGEPCGEDLTFCLRVGLAGFWVHVNTGVRIGHVKPTVLGAARYLAQREMQEQASD